MEISVKQIEEWKNNEIYVTNEIIQKISQYADKILQCNKENYPDNIFRYTRKITLINNLYKYLNKNPEFLCNMPLFLEQSKSNVNIFLNELVTMQKNITADLFLDSYNTLTAFANIAILIQTI